MRALVIPCCKSSLVLLPIQGSYWLEVNDVAKFIYCLIADSARDRSIQNVFIKTHQKYPLCRYNARKVHAQVLAMTELSNNQCVTSFKMRSYFISNDIKKSTRVVQGISVSQ